MPWAVLIPLLAKYAIPLVERLINNWSNPNPVTMEEWQELKAMAAVKPEDLLTQALTDAGIALDSDKAKELFELIKPKA